MVIYNSLSIGVIFIWDFFFRMSCVMYFTKYFDEIAEISFCNLIFLVNYSAVNCVLVSETIAFEINFVTAGAEAFNMDFTIDLSPQSMACMTGLNNPKAKVSIIYWGKVRLGNN
jgi:hypothetical protein